MRPSAFLLKPSKALQSLRVALVYRRDSGHVYAAIYLCPPYLSVWSGQIHVMSACVYPHSLIVGQQDTFVLSFLMLDEDTHLFSQVINRFVELFVDAISQTCD
jgi:hypothetical protein